MKKTLNICLGILIGAVLVLAVYRFGFRKSIPAGASQNEQVMAVLTQNDCFVCHAAEGETPLYGKMPGIGTTIQQHMAYAAEYCDLKARLADPDHVDQATLAMIEHAMVYGTMPIAQYKMLHWGTGFNTKEKSVLTEWINARRGHETAIWAIPESVELDEAKVDLGRRMFYDKRISLDGTLNCASCHILEIGGADEPDERTSEGINGLHGGVNAPTVYNAGFQVRQFWNGRAADLREQAEGPATNPVEMGDQRWDEIVARLSKDKELVKEFEALYPGEGLTQMTVTGAIAEFEKSLITPNCRFDRYLNGDEEALTAEEKDGYKLADACGCFACHTGVAMGGQSFEKPFIYGTYFKDRAEKHPEIEYNGDDDGLMGYTGNTADLHRYKVPMLRNIALTAPYFHDGTKTTLEQAVEAMGEYTLGKKFGDEQVNCIAAFLNTLTGENEYLGK